MRVRLRSLLPVLLLAACFPRNEDVKYANLGGACSDDTDCPLEQICEELRGELRCVPDCPYPPGDCRSQTDCGYGEVAVGSTCVPDCRYYGVECDHGACDHRTGTCEPLCRADRNCFFGDRCIDGRCVDSPPRDCSGECIAHDECAADRFCSVPAGEVLGCCARGCRDESSCAAGETCELRTHTCKPMPAADAAVRDAAPASDATVPSDAMAADVGPAPDVTVPEAGVPDVGPDAQP